MNLQKSIFQLGYEISPIILQNGIASFLSGNLLPIIAITEASNFTTKLLQGKNPLNLNTFFAHFEPMVGSTLIDNEIADYPFANQAVASNAIIARPKKISMKMTCPAQGSGGYVNKLITFTALKSALDSHNQSGGTYTVATPAFIYTNCILTSLTDVSPTDLKQVQTVYQFDFVQPLITLNSAQQVLNTLMSKIDAGLPTATSISGLDNTIFTPVSQLTSAVESLTGSFSNAIGSIF